MNIPLGDYSQAIDYTDREIQWIMKQHHLPSVAVTLVEDGLVDLDTSFAEYLPDVSIMSRFPDSAPITIRSILTHRAGLPRNEHH